MDMRSRTEASFRNILDCFSGADGGGSFYALRLLIEEMDKRAKKGDKAAEEVIEEIHRMSRLIDIANREMKGPVVDL